MPRYHSTVMLEKFEGENKLCPRDNCICTPRYHSTVMLEGFPGKSKLCTPDASLSDGCIVEVFPVWRENESLQHFKAEYYTQRNIFEILLNQTEIRLYLLFSD